MRITCKQAAQCFRNWSREAPYRAQAERYKGMAEVLEMFGEAPAPTALTEDWEFSREMRHIEGV